MINYLITEYRIRKFKKRNLSVEQFCKDYNISNAKELQNYYLSNYTYFNSEILLEGNMIILVYMWHNKNTKLYQKNGESLLILREVHNKC